MPDRPSARPPVCLSAHVPNCLTAQVPKRLSSPSSYETFQIIITLNRYTLSIMNEKNFSKLASWLATAAFLLVSLAIATAQTSAAALPPVAFLPLVSQAGQGPVLPPPNSASSRITVPPDFAIRIYASGLNATPRLMEIGPDGELYVALLSSGQVVRLPDRNDDGLSDGVEVAASGMNQPHNMEWHNGYLYIAQTDKVQRFTDANADGVYNVDPAFTPISLPTGGHSTRTLHFGPDGKLYVSVGSSCNACVESDPRRAAILRFNDDGSIPADNPFALDANANKRPVWAWGIRNSVDFTWTPVGALWASSHGSDNILDGSGQPDTRPPEELVIPVQANKNFGWPYCYTPVNGLNSPTQPEVRDTSNFPGNSFDCSLGNVIPALFTGPAHAAPIGMGWGPSSFWPAEYRDDLYLALHGSWNTNNPANYRDCKVERILVVNGQVTGSVEFANGWRAPGGKCGDAATYGRPADVVVNAQGEMFISDDKADRIYRVVYIGN